MKNQMSTGNFKAAVVKLYQHAKATGPMVQELIEDALLQADHPAKGGHGSLNKLTILIHGCQQAKSLPTNTIKRYIQQHVDAKWCKLPDGTYGFKFNGSPASTQPEVAWYDWEGNKEKDAKPDVNIVQSLKSLIARAEKAAKEGKKVEGAEHLPAMKKTLREMTAEVHAA